MSDHTHIEWTDATWNPITGCSVISAGCKHCYAMRLAGTRLRHHPSRAGLTRPTAAGPVWTGDVRLNEDWLDQPLRWKKPRRIFVCAHGDLFHEAVPDAWIDRVFAVMALAPQHTFQVLTKRPERMLAYQNASNLMNRIHAAIFNYTTSAGGATQASLKRATAWLDTHLPDGGLGGFIRLLPTHNVHLGVSVENQATADERIPLLLQTPAAVRFISAEPLLGLLNLRLFLPFITRGRGGPVREKGGLDWVIAGGESGPGARPSHPDWFRVLRDQCQASGVAFFFKQWGEWLPMMGHVEGVPVRRQKFRHPDGTIMGCAGKRAAGRLLDGCKGNEFPAVAQ